MQKVRLFAKCFKTKRNCRVQINPNFKLDFSPKVLTNLFKTTGLLKRFINSGSSWSAPNLPLRKQGQRIRDKQLESVVEYKKMQQGG
jgi:hypothetical protein